jgi:type I restriction enzyme S subunit
MSGKYQAYPVYKDSGIQWIGRIPSHWTRSLRGRSHFLAE